MSKTESRENYVVDTLGLQEYGVGTLKSIFIDSVKFEPRTNLLIIGEPGLGKTVITTDVAKATNSVLLTCRLVNEDEGTMNGYANPNDDGESVSLLVVDRVRRKVMEAKESGKNLIVFFDEVNRAKEHLIKYIFNIMDTKLWGDLQLPENTTFFAAINPPTKNHKVRDILADSALRRRFTIYGATADVDEYITYARDNKIHKAVWTFLKGKPDFLYDFHSLDNKKPYACPATWDRIGDIVGAYEKTNKLSSIGKNLSVRARMEGKIGAHYTAEFIDHAQDMDKNYGPDNIINNYKDVQQDILDCINSEFVDAEEDNAVLTLGKLTSIGTNVGIYVADQLMNEKMFYHISDEDVKGAKHTKNKQKNMNKLSRNLCRFLQDVNSEIFKTTIGEIKQSLEGGDRSDLIKEMHKLSNYEEYKKAAEKFLTVTT